ncbi:hypothetical protein [Roseovarius sp. M141]|uniref:hypothetical protein n=1 Tax=Roseovarius sp. M141 TaxID=2583806 RepID=UPI0034E95737
MLTGARRRGSPSAVWEHFNLEHLSWSKPASMTKQRKIHRLSNLRTEAAAIVRQRQYWCRADANCFFPGDVPGQPVKEIRRFWANIQKQVRDSRMCASMIYAAPSLHCWSAAARRWKMIEQASGPQPDRRRHSATPI